MEIEAMTGPTSSSIADRSIECRQSFHQLCNLLNKSDVWSEQISLPAVQDEFGRFRVWAGNVGAHRSGRVSLDYRLREAEKMRQQVTNLLNDLESNLREGGSSVTTHLVYCKCLTSISARDLVRQEITL